MHERMYIARGVWPVLLRRDAAALNFRGLSMTHKNRESFIRYNNVLCGITDRNTRALEHIATGDTWCFLHTIGGVIKVMGKMCPTLFISGHNVTVPVVGSFIRH